MGNLSNSAKLINKIKDIEKSYIVVNELPDISEADNNKIYILGPIGNSLDKYEEWVADYGPAGHFTSETGVTVYHQEYSGNDEYSYNKEYDDQEYYAGISNLHFTGGYSGQSVWFDDEYVTCTSIDLLNETLPIIYYDIETGEHKATYMPHVYTNGEGTQYTLSYDLSISTSDMTWSEVPELMRMKIGETTADLSAYPQKTEVLLKRNTTLYNPSDEFHPATKLYVDVNKHEYTFGEGLEETGRDFSAIQGPCEDGFHIPTSDEIFKLRDVLNRLKDMYGGDVDFISALKMSGPGSRDYKASHYYLGSNSLWSCNKGNMGNVPSPYAVHNDGIEYDPNHMYANNTTGLCIRPFKNVAVPATWGWRTMYGGYTDYGFVGIFWDYRQKLVSISSNGLEWITISDRNLGATTYYEEGQTRTQSNCGKFYQWGNCYGFPFDGAVTTSRDTIDLTGYGPGNYYSSDIWRSKSNRDTSNNQNLWGGEVGIIENMVINTGVTSVNGQTGDVVIASPEESNTKTFYLSSTSDLTTAQTALDWYLAGKNPIVVYSNRAYILISYSQSRLEFKSAGISLNQNLASETTIWQPYMSFAVSSGTVTSVSVTNLTDGHGILQTDRDYQTPYTPQYNGSPATKKYVDDKSSAVSGISTAQPSSPSIGSTYYDTTNNALMVYDGTQWNTVGGGGGGGGSSLGSFFKAMKANGTVHTRGITNGLTYTFQGLGYVFISSMDYGYAFQLNGVTIFSESFSSGGYTTKYYLGPYTASAGDVAYFYIPGSQGRISGTIYDYY